VVTPSIDRFSSQYAQAARNPEIGVHGMPIVILRRILILREVEYEQSGASESG